MRKFVKFKVEVVVDKALCLGHLVTWEGEKVWIQFKNVFRPYICFACGVIGHDQRLCESKPEGIADISRKLVPLYSVWMKVDNTLTDCFQQLKRRRTQQQGGL